jgi:hypothetical protein
MRIIQSSAEARLQPLFVQPKTHIAIRGITALLLNYLVLEMCTKKEKNGDPSQPCVNDGCAPISNLNIRSRGSEAYRPNQLPHLMGLHCPTEQVVSIRLACMHIAIIRLLREYFRQETLAPVHGPRLCRILIGRHCSKSKPLFESFCFCSMVSETPSAGFLTQL